MATLSLCYAGCGISWAACYAAAGLIAGTVTAGVGAPAAALACNAAEGTCMTACTGVGAPAAVAEGYGLVSALVGLAGSAAAYLGLKGYFTRS